MQSSWVANENIENIQDGFFSLNSEWRFTYVNRRAVSILGKEPIEFIGKVIWEESPSIIGTELEDAYRKAMDLRVVQHLKTKGFITDVWYDIFVYPTAEGISIYWQDISKQILIDKEQNETQDKYRMLINSIDQGFYVIDVIFDENGQPIDMYYVEANESATRIVGADFTKQYIREFDPHYESYWFEIFGQVALTGESIRMEQYAEPDKKWYSFYIFKIGDENSRRIGNIFLDITERKRTEEALHNSEEKLRMILENSRDGINMLDLSSGKYVYMNPAQVKMTGYSAEEINNISAEEAYALVYPDDREVSIEQHKLVAAGLDTFHDVEYRWKVKSGEYRWFNDRRKLIRDEQGNAIAMVGISRDITEHKIAEVALKESEEKYRHQLQQEVNDRTAELQESKELLSAIIQAQAVSVCVFKAIRNHNGDIIDLEYSFANEVTKKLAYGLELEGVHYSDIFPNIGESGVLDLFIEVIESGKMIDKEITYTDDGLTGWFRLIAVKFGDGIVLNTEFITDRKEAEFELIRVKDMLAEKATDKYLMLFNSIDEGFNIVEMILDDKGELVDYLIVETNPAMQNMTGFSQVVGKYAHELKPNYRNILIEKFG
ncbi:MAG: PAS domain S-box protein [Mobilitalea sp.]